MRSAVRLVPFVIFSCLAIPGFAGFASTETFLPAVGRLPGLNGAQFYTTVWATNLTGVPVTFTFDFLKNGQANPSPANFQDTLSPGQTKMYENVVESKLGLTNALGAARVTSSGEILVAERIYNQAPQADLGDTEGLFFAGVPKSFSIVSGQSASIQGVNQGGAENFRYNFALIETGGGSPTVNVQVFDGNGALLGQKAYPLSPYEQLQPGVADVVPGFSSINARITATVTGGTGSVLLAGAQLANASQDSSGFEMSFRDDILGSGGGASGVTSLNGLTGALSLAAGTNITLTNVGSNSIRIDAAGGGGGLSSVSHNATLAGNGTGGTPLGVAVPLTLTGALPGAAVVAISNLASGVSGGGIGLTATSAGPGLGVGGGSDSGFGVEGSSKTGIGVVGIGTQSGQLGNFPSGAGVIGVGTTVGVYGVAAAGGTGVSGKVDGSQPAVQGFNNGAGPGVEGDSNTGTGVYGSSGGLGGAGNGVYGVGTAGGGTGVHGIANVGPSAYGVWGESTSGFAGYFNGNVNITGHLKAFGITLAVSPHPIQPEMEIRYVSLEGRESGTYFRGTARIVNGFATIEVPEDFRMVTAEKGLTVVVTPVGGLAVLAAVHQGLDKIIIQGSSDVDFNYMVNGVRKGSEDFAPVARNEDFVPRSAEDKEFARDLDANAIATLKANGILNADGTINSETAHRLGWDLRPGWRQEEPKSDRVAGTPR